MTPTARVRRQLCARRAMAASIAVLATAGWAIGAAPAEADTPAYVPNEVVVAYQPGRIATMAAAAGRHMGIRAAAEPGPEARVRILRLPRGVSVAQAISQLRRTPGVAYAVPNLIAHPAGPWLPDDPGRARHAGGWEAMQWNFLARAGVDAPVAWSNLIADRHPGGRGVVVAILDTGVAYRNWKAFKKSPDFTHTRFVDPYDFVARNRYPLDREGHGTFVAGTVAEATNNAFGLTGLAYGASVMPVRVLDANGNGDAATISRGIRYAATHGAKVINLSLEFPIGTSSDDIPDILSAIRFAHRRGVVVVAASGNDSVNQLAYPARDSDAISVGGTTKDRCLADYSNDGSELDLVAPGGGYDTGALSDPNCHPERNLPGIYQMTLVNPPNWSKFGFPGGYYGTSMASAHVAAIAALVIASGVIGRHPSPDQVRARLEQTAKPLGGSKPNSDYGYGLVDAAAATTR